MRRKFTIFHRKKQLRGEDYRTAVEAALLFAVFYLPGYLRQTGRIDPQLFLSPRFHLFYMISALPQLLLLLYILSVTREDPVSRYGLRAPRWREVGPTLATLLGVGAVAVAAAALTSSLDAGSPFSSDGLGMQEGLVSLSLYSPLTYLLIFATCLLIGYHEELFFRAYLLGEFAPSQLRQHRSFPESDDEIPEWGGSGEHGSPDRSTFVKAAGASVGGSLLFAGGHLYQGFTGFFATFAIGLFLSYRYLRRRSLHEVAVAHSLYNFFAIVLLIHFLPSAV
jgi:membrane protease YdiL (CAAX protease family)